MAMLTQNIQMMRKTQGCKGAKLNAVALASWKTEENWADLPCEELQKVKSRSDFLNWQVKAELAQIEKRV